MTFSIVLDLISQNTPCIIGANMLIFFTIYKSDDWVALYGMHFLSESGTVGAAWNVVSGLPPGAAV